MESFDKKKLIVLLEEIADYLDFKGENRFKVGAFRNGAGIIRRYQDNFEEKIKNRQLEGIKGIGKGLQEVIYEFYDTGEAKAHKQALMNVPEGIEDILNIRGLGPKKAALLYEKLNITNIGELEKACQKGIVQELKGFSASTEQKILHEIKTGEEHTKYVLLSKADLAAGTMLESLRKFQSVEDAAITGELRRAREIISAIEFVVYINDKKKFFEELRKDIYPELSDEGDKILVDNERVPIIFHLSDSKGAFKKKLFITTGSEGFIEKLGINVNKIPEANEKEIFKTIKFGYLAPEMREEQFFKISEPKLKKNTTLHEKDFHGFLHFHTNFSDGLSSLKEMVSAAKNFGYSYFAVCDHSKTAYYANGLNEDRILKQKKEIEKTAKALNVTIFHGIESDILNGGELDYAPDILKTFDFIVASIHSNFTLDKKAMTDRIIKAVENPYTDVLAHPTGRLLLNRAPYEVAMEKVIDACAQNKVAIEVNANPHRLDLDWRKIYQAREKGCYLSINQDAHATAEINNLRYGVAIARKAGVQRTEIINCFYEEQFKNFLSRKVNRSFL